MSSSPKTVVFESIVNYRDVAVSVNRHDSTGSLPRLRLGRLYRSARLDEATAQDRESLVNDVGIKTVLDLRSNTEHINAAKKRSAIATLAQPAVVPVPNDKVTESLKIPGLRYEEINVNGKGFERALVWQLSYYSLARMLFLMAFGIFPPQFSTCNC